MSPRSAAHKAPFPYFGGKANVAHEVWSRLGDVGRYVEPFVGSAAVLLVRPEPYSGIEIINDLDGLLVNVWRAMAADPDAVVEWADWPSTENDLHARHAWLVGQREDITRRLEGDPHWYDAKAAGWWLWGISLWIGGGWCSGDGPWRVTDGQLLHAGNNGQGIHRQRLHAGDNGQGIAKLFGELSARLRDVLVMCGDWTRVVTPAVLQSAGSGKPTGIFLDPPYADTASRSADLYAKDSEQVAHAVREWAIANGDNPRYRIALCGYDGEHQMPDSWSEFAWKADGGYEVQAKTGRTGNSKRERIWFSPHCLRPGLWEQGA